MKILILEDEQRNAKRLIRLLNDIDRTFIVEGPLASIKETVEFFQSGKTTDLILADIRLTEGLSFEALKHAQATVPIIFTTAYDEYAVQAFKFNSFDYLLKPLDADELEAAIDKATKAGKNYADENLRQLFDSLQKNQFRYRERFLLPYRDGYKTVRVSDINRGHWMSTEEILEKVLADNFADVTFSGGDPMFQPEGFTQLAHAIKERSRKNIWCYTGYTFEKLLRNPRQAQLLKYIDVLVDGKFKKELRDEELYFRGSRNQRLIDVQTSLQKGETVIYHYNPKKGI